jgi:type II restriction enzyme
LRRLSANNLARAIDALPKNIDYGYVAKSSKGLIRIVDVQLPEGPIYVKRYHPGRKETPAGVETVSISTEMLWRLANALSSEQPINVDRVFGGSYNTRSVLEALLAHTPQFSMCKPGRVQQKGAEISIENGHKHIWWTPESPHSQGTIAWLNTEKTISEIPSADVVYEAIDVGPPKLDVPEGIQRRHAQIQIALLTIGKALGFKNTVAREDQHITYMGKRLIELDYVVPHVEDLQQVMAHPDAVGKLRHIDVGWFKNGKLIPALFEVEHSTGIKSGLDRLRGFQDALPGMMIRYVIVADDDEFGRAKNFANEERFAGLNAKFLPYSAVDELFSLCTRHELKGVTDKFLDSFMKDLVVSS